MPRERNRDWQSAKVRRAFEVVREGEVPPVVVDALAELASARNDVAASNLAAAPVKKSPPTDWERFKTWYTAASPVALFLMGLLYVLWDQPMVGYPWPGRVFWNDSQVNNAAVMSLAGVMAVAMLRPILATVLTILFAALLVAALFR